MTDSPLAPGRAHRTPCPRNTWCSDRIIGGLCCSLDTEVGTLLRESDHIITSALIPDGLLQPPPPLHNLQATAGCVPPQGRTWVWTEAHATTPPPNTGTQTQGRAGHRPTVGCGSPQQAVCTGTHNHRPTGHAGATPARAPKRKLIQQRWDAAGQYPDKSTQTSEDQPNNDATHIRVYRSQQKTKRSSSLPPRPAWRIHR